MIILLLFQNILIVQRKYSAVSVNMQTSLHPSNTAFLHSHKPQEEEDTDRFPVKNFVKIYSSRFRFKSIQILLIISSTCLMWKYVKFFVSLPGLVLWMFFSIYIFSWKIYNLYVLDYYVFEYNYHIVFINY